MKEKHAETGTAKKRKRFPYWALALSIICLLALGWTYRFVDAQIETYEKFNEMRRKADVGNTFYPGVHVDGVDLGGMTMEEARQALSGKGEKTAEEFEIILAAGDLKWRISSQEVPLSWNTEEVLRKAYAVGRGGSLQERYLKAVKLESMGEYFETEFTYDRALVRKLTDTVASRLSVECKNAMVVAFDVMQKSFAYSDEQIGQQVDAEALYQQVISLLDAGEYGVTIPVQVVALYPQVTRAQLEEEYGLITSFTTETTDDRDRNTNIRLAAEALNGTMIEAGGTISFNSVTGQRTRDKGYKEAGAIAGGQTIEEIGGGVCQVSTTLFNALMRANASIVTRYGHAWPSDYVPRGEDATVDWPNVDLVMRNESAAPMFITAWYENQQVTVQVFGLSLGQGIELDLYSETVYTSKPDENEVVYTYNPDLPLGTEKLVKKPRTGYKVETYLITYENGQEVSREHAYTTNYRKILKEFEYNDGNPPPEMMQ